MAAGTRWRGKLGGFVVISGTEYLALFDDTIFARFGCQWVEWSEDGKAEEGCVPSVSLRCPCAGFGSICSSLCVGFCRGKSLSWFLFSFSPFSSWFWYVRGCFGELTRLVSDGSDGGFLVGG